MLFTDHHQGMPNCELSVDFKHNVHMWEPSSERFTIVGLPFTLDPTGGKVSMKELSQRQAETWEPWVK